MEDDTVLKRVPNRSLTKIFALGFSAPSFLIMPSLEFQVLRRGEVSRHAWESVGNHMTRSWRRTVGERG